MVAAVMTPTSVQKTYIHATSTYGTPVRLVRYFVVVTTVTTADWIIADTYCPGNYLGSTGFCIDSSGNGSETTMSFEETEDEIVMTNASTVGTAYLEVLCEEA